MIKKLLNALLGCTVHDFENSKELDEYKVMRQKPGYSYVVLVRVEQECTHEGCSETRRVWNRINYIPEGVDSGCNRVFRDRLNEVINYP